MVGNSGRGAVEIRLLPAFEVFRGDGSLSLPTRAQRLIALLAISGGPVARLTVAERLWPDASEARACASLRATLWGLSRAPWSPVVVDNEALMLDCTTNRNRVCARAGDVGDRRQLRPGRRSVWAVSVRGLVARLERRMARR